MQGIYLLHLLQPVFAQRRCVLHGIAENSSFLSIAALRKLKETTCELPGNPKVADFDSALSGKQYIRRLDIPVHAVLRMQVDQCLQHLAQNVCNLWLPQWALVQLQNTMSSVNTFEFAHLFHTDMVSVKGAAECCEGV